ncbi:MAG: DNA polymerase III subunit epsilon [Burkholderiales bacterium]|nr:DNA polymerase III subunit epsilon [Burkholderiales bacterium]
MTRLVFLDTETTGLDADKGDRIVEIGCVEMVERRLSGRTLHLYLNPGRSSHPEALKVHGLSDAFLADKPTFADVAGQLLDFVRGAELVIHNAAFDVGFVDAELARARRGRIADVVTGVVDTLAMARDLYPGKANSLDALCRRLEVDASARTLHGALVDAGLLAEVYIRMTRGQESLVMDAQVSASVQVELQAVDFSRIALPVIAADAGEVAAHEAMLADLDGASGGKTLWRSEQPMA